MPSSFDSMVRSSLSHSQALRVVGQRLHGNVTAFELSKKDENYVIRIPVDSDVTPPAVGKMIGRTIESDEARSASLVVRFTPVDIFMDDALAKLRRVKPNGFSNLTHLSDGLRVLGDYLERHAAGDFTILWSSQSAKVSSAGKEQCFTAQNLYDLGILIQLRSSSRSRPP